VLAYRIVVAMKVYIRHISSCWLLLILIADRDISIWYDIYTGGAKKMCTHFKRQVDTLVNVAQAVVRRSQKCRDADGNHFEHLL
jgi:hypothetical protein